MLALDPNQWERIDQLAEEFVQRYRRGERPTLKEYLDKYPELADEIRTLFPTLVEMEQVKEGQDDQGPAAVETSVSRQIGDYRIIRELGRGGMGVVYEAEQVSLGRRVALKVLPPHFSSDQRVLERFRREARSAAKLHHTNIVPVFDVGQDGDTCYYAMQFIQGQSLDQILVELQRLRGRTPDRDRSGSTRGGLSAAPAPGSSVGTGVLDLAADQLVRSLLTGRFHMDLAAVEAEEVKVCIDPPEALDFSSGAKREDAAALADAASSAVLPGQTDLSSVRTDRPHYFQSVARIGWQTANALAYAHARGIIHRDIKPSNLLLDTAGVVWIADFGLAKTEEVALTTTGDIIGTLRYMAPERLQGKGDERSDVYALGLTLYELLVLRPAFAARDRLQLLDRIKNQEPVRPRVLDRRIPRDLETIVLKAIHKEPKQRYQTAEEMAEDLRRFLADEPIKARRTGQLSRLRLWVRRHPALAALLLLLVLSAVGTTASAFYLRATLIQSEEHRRRAEDAEMEGKHKLWLSYLSQAQARRMSQQPGQRFASLRAIKEALALPVPPGHSRDELRNEAIAALCLPDLELAWEGGKKPLGAAGFTIDPAFQRYAWADKEGKVHICRLSDDKELLQLPGGGPVDEYVGLRFSPNGRFLHQRCNTGRGFLSRLWDLGATSPKVVFEDNYRALAFRPDNREFAAAFPDRTVRFFETRSGRELRRFRVEASTPDLLWNPKLPQLLISERTGLWLLNADSGAVVEVGLKVAGGFSWATWHPEGRLLAVSGEADHKIYLWDVPGGRLVMPPLEGHNTGGVVMCFSPTGDRLLSADWSQSGCLWDAQSGRILLTLPGLAVHLSFRADERLIGTGGDGTPHLFHYRKGEELRTLVHHGGRRAYGKATALDAEGRLFAVNTDEGVALVDTARREEAALLPLPGNHPLCFDSEGALWTHGVHGLLRWPAAVDAQTGQRCFGPPQWFYGKTNLDRHGSSTDARIVVMPRYNKGAMVFYRDGQRTVALGEQEDVRNCAVSPDGRWIVTGSHSLHEGAGAKVWDAQDGRHVKDLPVGGLCSGRFSPDGRWLLTASREGPRLWRVGTWEEGPKLTGTWHNSLSAFTHDGKLLALGGKPGVVRLVSLETGAEIARLTTPERARLLPCCFTPDDAQLIAASLETMALHIFDLHAIRAGLVELGLNWGPSPETEKGASLYLSGSRFGNSNFRGVVPPLSIQFELGDVRQWPQAWHLLRDANQHLGKGEYAKALVKLRQAIKVAPGFALTHNNLAWLLLTGPKDLRDPQQALVEAHKAVELNPDQAMYLNTLGVALYYTGKLADAIPTLERSLRKQGGQADAFDLFFLAMCHHGLGETEKAKNYLEHGKQWFQEHKGMLPASWVKELSVFQAEAEAVLAQSASRSED